MCGESWRASKDLYNSPFPFPILKVGRLATPGCYSIAFNYCSKMFSYNTNISSQYRTQHKTKFKPILLDCAIQITNSMICVNWKTVCLPVWEIWIFEVIMRVSKVSADGYAPKFIFLFPISQTHTHTNIYLFWLFPGDNSKKHILHSQ